MLQILIERIKAQFERFAFGVCSWWGEKLGLRSSNIRLFFIYTSFITIGSPIIVYLVMAFILKHKQHFKLGFVNKQNSWNN